MATFKTAVATAQAAALLNVAAAASSRDIGRDLKVARVRYPLAGTEDAATSDIIHVLQLPAGAIVLPELCSITCDDPGTTLTGTLGFNGATETTDPDAFSSAMTLSSGGVVRCTPTVMDSIEFATGAVVTFSVASDDTLTAAADLWFTIAYTLKK